MDSAGRRLFPTALETPSSGIAAAKGCLPNESPNVQREAPKMTAPLIGEEEKRANVLVVALDVVPLEPSKANVLVVAPALNSRLRRWLSDEDRARGRAADRLQAY